MQAASIAATCSSTSLANLIALGSGGCTIDDKLYSNFSYTGLAGAPVASLVNASVDENLPTLLTGFTFTVPGGAFNGNFIIGFSIAVVPGPPCPLVTCVISSTIEQMLPGTNPPGNQAATITYTGGVGPLTVNNTSLTGGNLTAVAVVPSLTTLTKTITTAGITSAQPVVSFESDIHQTASQPSGIPEPGTYSYMLLGLGLSVVGMSGKWRKKRA